MQAFFSRSRRLGEHVSANAVGADGVRSKDLKTAGEQLDRELAMPGFCIMEALVDPHTAMSPAKINAKLAIHVSKSPLRGEPNRMRAAQAVTTHGRSSDMVTA